MSAPPRFSLLRSPAAALIALAALGGCNPVTNSQDPFPLSVGFTPLEPVVPSAAFPVAVDPANDPCPQGLGEVVAVPNFSHYTSHARGYLQANVARVYLALQDPASSYIHNQAGTTKRDRADDLGVESFPLSYVVHYRSETPIAGTTIVTRFDVTYRGGPLQGSAADPVVVGQRYQKTWGVADIHIMAGSLVASPVDGCPGVTGVEMVAWLKATTQGQADCDGTLRDLFDDLQAVLAALPP
jgi:hypothetical protein